MLSEVLHRSSNWVHFQSITFLPRALSYLKVRFRQDPGTSSSLLAIQALNVTLCSIIYRDITPLVLIPVFSQLQCFRIMLLLFSLLLYLSWMFNLSRTEFYWKGVRVTLVLYSPPIYQARWTLDEEIIVMGSRLIN